MALDKTRLTADILAAFKSTESLEDPAEQQQTLASKLSDAIEHYVKSGRVQDIAIDPKTFKQASPVEIK